MKFISTISRRWCRTNQSSVMLLGLGFIIALPCVGESPVNLKQALELTLKQNAELKSYPLIVRGAEALELQAEVTPNPIVNIEIENSIGSGDYQGLDSSEINLVYSQQIELGNKQQNRVNFASAETRRLQSEYQLSRLDVLAETSRRYYQNIFLQQQQTLIEKKITSEKNALTVIQKRAKAGAVGEADVSKMALRLARSEVRKEQLAAELKQAQTRLAAMWMAEAEFNVVNGRFDQIPEVPNRKSIIVALEKLPSVHYQIALQRLSETRLKLAQSNGQSDMTFKVGLTQHQQTSDQSLNFAFSMPLAFENPNRGRIKAAQTAIEKSYMEVETHKKQLELRLLEIRQQLLNQKGSANLLNTRLLPLAKKLLAETEKGYQTGRYSVLQWIDAQSEVFSIEQSMLKLHWQVYRQILELERITGQSMAKSTTLLTGEKQ